MRRILLCGKSLLICGLHASLGMMPDLDVQLVDTQQDNILDQLATWKPEVLILETDLLQKTFSRSSLQDLSHLKIIGLDIEDNCLHVYSGMTSYQPTPEQLLQIIAG